jgi:endonuclease-3 related protein
LRLYDRLHRRYAAQGRRPGLWSLDVMIGAILTQRPAAVNVERAVRKLARQRGVSLRQLMGRPADELRPELLALPGIGPATADAILLHAAGRPVFVVDAAARRVVARHGIATATSSARLKALFMANLPHDPALFRQYHALLVRVARDHCGARPRCDRCPLRFDLRGRPPRRP